MVEKMDTIPQYTFAGDYTVEAIEKASQEVAKFDAGMRSATDGVGGLTDSRSLDDWFVITVTDANFGRYNITPEYITRTMAKFPRVNNAVVCLGDGLEVALCVPFSVSDRRLLLKALQAHTEVPQNVLPGAEYCGYSERIEEHPLKYGREMKDAPACQIHLFIVPSLLWVLCLGFSALRVQKVLPAFAAPRWLAHWLEPEGKQRKRRTPRVSPVRDQISHRMQGSTAMPVEETIGGGRDGRRDTYLPGSVPVQSDWNHSAPCTDHRANHRIQESSLSVCSWSGPTLVDVKGG